MQPDNPQQHALRYTARLAVRIKAAIPSEFHHRVDYALDTISAEITRPAREGRTR